MPYKKESPFASFRDPKRPTRNYNPTNFQMPDIDAIFNKTADGDKIEEPQKAKDNNVKDKVAGPVLDKIDNPDTGPITRKSLRQDRRAGEKDFNKELRRVKRLSKASSKDITAEQKGKLETQVKRMEKEKEFRKKAAKLGENPEDVMLKPIAPIKAKSIDPGIGERMTKVNIDAALRDLAAQNKATDKKYKDDPMLADIEQPASRDLIGDPRMRNVGPVNVGGLQNNPDNTGMFKDMNYAFKDNEYRDLVNLRKGPNMKQVNSKGSGFPMIQPNQNMAEPEQIKNRAGRPQDSNILTNDPNINQPMNKVAASNFRRNAQFNDIASGQGVYNPPQSTMPMPNQSANNQTPQQQTFPQQGSFAMYDGPEFNEGLRKASAEGKLDNNPKFKAAVDNAPSMISKGPAGVKIKPQERKMKKGEKERLKNTVELPESGYGLQTPGKDMFSPSTPNTPPKGTRYNLAKDQSVKPAEYESPGMYDGPSMKRAFKAFDHAHTKVTKDNLKATERDDAAHMSYLKRDIKYDNTHGGSKKQMLDDEKHISKLAGDLKYDAKKKRS